MASVAIASALAAATPDPFFGSTALTIVVGSDAGGAHDLFARTLARHLGRHIPGDPPIVVQDMPGANGIVAANYIANVAPKDGSVIAALAPGDIIEPLIEKHGPANYDPRKIGWIGNISRIQLVCTTWFSNPVKTVEDARRRQVVVGAGSSASATSILPNIMNQLLGTKFKVITGYSVGNLKLALERGEIGGVCGWGWSTLEENAPEWLRDHKLNFLAQTGLSRMKQLPNVPLVSEFASGMEDRAIFRLLTYREVLGRPYAAPPGVPPARLRLLRSAFAETMRDPAYLEDAHRARQEVDFTDARGMEAIIADAYSMPPKVIARVGQLTHPHVR